MKTPHFYYADPDALGAIQHTEIPCPGHPQFGHCAYVFEWPEGSELISKPTEAFPGAQWRVALPDGREASADCQTLWVHLHPTVRA